MEKLKNFLWLAGLSLVSSLVIWTAAGSRTIYQNFDGPYYLAVARCWYDKECIRQNYSFPIPLEYYPAHYPGYPLLINLVSAVGPARAMVAVNALASVAASWLVLAMAYKFKVKHPMWLAAAFLFIWPRVWAVRSVGSPEMLFVAAVLASLLAFEAKKYWLAGLAGAAAVLTKSPGVLLLAGYGVWAVREYFLKKQIPWRIWPVGLIGVTLVGIFSFYQWQTGDFWAYFNSGDNIHLQLVPFRVFDSNQSWVGDFWLEDVLWVYLVAGIGIFRCWKKSPVLASFASVFFATILFVSHRDISRYSLPVVPMVLLGLAELMEKKEVRWAIALLIIPMFFYTLNFINFNQVQIADWKLFL